MKDNFLDADSLKTLTEYVTKELDRDLLKCLNEQKKKEELKRILEEII